MSYYKKLINLIVFALIMGIILLSLKTINVKAVYLVEINLTKDNLNWGAGSVNSGVNNATLDSYAGTVTGGSWTANDGDLIIENIGTEDVILDIHSNKNADDLVGGSSNINSFQWIMSEIEKGSCKIKIDKNNKWNEVNTTSPGSRICNKFLAKDKKDTIKIDFKIVIPSDTTKEGLQAATITITATGT